MPDVDVTLVKNFDIAMEGIYHSALAETGYHAKRFLKMLHELGGLETARILINSTTVSDGYTALWERKRLDLTVEALIVENVEWHALFSPEDIEICRNRLKEYSYPREI